MLSKTDKLETIKKIQALIFDLDYIQDFRALEAEIFKDQEILSEYERMKQLQKETMMFHKIGKNEAHKASSQAAHEIEEKLKADPKIAEYFVQMQDVSDLLQYLTNGIEDRFNEKLLAEDEN